ncbi:unnamed protein product [Brugia timori]|uniref:Uncharacterized protein n=1 Tax=Brugia timori TaxID=42155 RepID=A0A0R3RCQ4_9BILA|nr:unnamed protein product [Brugia timori]
MAEWSKAPDSSNNVYASHENLKVCLGCSGIVIDAWVRIPLRALALLHLSLFFVLNFKIKFNCIK